MGDRRWFFSDIQFIAGGTPPDEHGSADLKYVLAVASTIAQHTESEKIVVNKSTVPVGTADKVIARMTAVLADADASVVVTEWRDFKAPDFPYIRAALNNPAVFDEHNLYDPQRMQDQVSSTTGLVAANRFAPSTPNASDRRHFDINIVMISSANLCSPLVTGTDPVTQPI